MSLISNVNILSTNSSTDGTATCLYYLKETLKSAGWKVLSSSNGTTLTGYTGGTSGPDSITSVGVMNSASAWFRITDPSDAKEFVMMRGSAISGVMKYSKASKFASGGNATTLPTTGGGDGIPLVSTLTTDSGTTTVAQALTFITAPSNPAAARLHFLADTVPNNGTYAWYVICQQSITNTNISFLSHEAIQSGSCSPLDNDQSWFIISDGATNVLGTLGNLEGTSQTFTAPASGFSTSPGRTWFKYNLTGSTFERAIGSTYSANNSSTVVNQVFPGNIGSNPYDGYDNGIPFLVRSVSFPKGLSTGLKWRGTSKAFPSVIDDGSGNQYIHVDDLLVPWISGSVATTSS